MAPIQPFLGLWFQAGLRALSVVLLLISLAFAVYCRVAYGQDLELIYGLGATFVVLDAIALARAVVLLSNHRPHPTRREASCTLCIDIIVIVVAIIIGIVVFLFSAPGPECHSPECLSRYAPYCGAPCPSFCFGRFRVSISFWLSLMVFNVARGEIASNTPFHQRARRVDETTGSDTTRELKTCVEGR
ncbi:hypothetical protein VTI74DRAFT_9012 [Chaetomium olivicolor]